MDGASFFKTLLQSKATTAPIQFSGDDETNSFPVSGSEVTMVTSGGDHDLGSSKLKIKNIVNFSWDHRWQHGQVVAAHLTGTYIAYAITTPKNVGVVRVVNRATEARLLVKGMRGPVRDLAFAHTAAEVVLGCTDSQGNLFVHRVTEAAGGLASERVLEVVRESVPEQEEEHRLIWCPYLPEPGGEEEEEEEADSSAARLLVLTHGPRAEVWSLDLAVEAHGAGPLAPGAVTAGLIHIASPGEGAIIDAAFSPDGSALATASEDGEVKFFQVYMHEEGAPRCLHQWSPHGGAPVSSLYFLDNHSASDHLPETQFWKFAVTGSAHNSELKVWSCETWSCLQTITVTRPPGDASPVRLKSAIDPTASYLLLADIDKCLVFVLSLAQGGGGARVVSTSEFATPAAFLSFCCVSAGRRLVKQTTEGVQVDGQEEEEVRSGKERTVVRLYLVTPKSLQECSIIYEDAAAVGGLEEAAEVSFQEPSSEEQELGVSVLGLEEVLSPARPESHSTPRSTISPAVAPSAPLTLPPPPATLTLPTPTTPPAPLALTTPLPRPTSNVEQLAEAASKISLLSPDQFKIKPDVVSASSLVAEASGEASEEEVTPPVLERVAHRPVVSESGNSSPSREVAHILSVEEPAYSQASQEASPDRTFQEEDSLSPSPAPLAHFPTPPAVPRGVPAPAPAPSDHGDGLAEVVRSLQAQLKEDREVQVAAMARLERRLEAAVAREQQAEAAGQRLEGLLARQAAREEVARKEQTEALLASLSSTLVTRVDQVVTGELKRSLPGAVTRALDGVKAAVERELAARVRGLEVQLEGTINELVGKTVNHPGTREAMARSVAAAVRDLLQATITSTYTAAFRQQVPDFERALQKMLRQVAEQFQQGTREYEVVLQRRLEVEETARREEVAPLVAGVAGGLQEVRGEVAALTRSMTGLARQLEAGRVGVSADEVRDIVRREVSGALGSLGRPGEAPQADVKTLTMRQTVQGCIQRGQIEEAFQAALSAGDLALVVFTCELLNTTQVFNSATCPLSQSVLLSLIQQLSVDLGDKTEVKHSFLHEALVNLDPKDPTTKAHGKVVLTALDAALRQYIMANPNSKMTRNMKLLVMACSTHMQ